MRNKREQVFEEMRDILDIDVAEIKAKITSLRAQLGREIGKTKAESFVFSSKDPTCCDLLRAFAHIG